MTAAPLPVLARTEAPLTAPYPAFRRSREAAPRGAPPDRHGRAGAGAETPSGSRPAMTPQ